jgi:hypothetical protein
MSDVRRKPRVRCFLASGKSAKYQPTRRRLRHFRFDGCSGVYLAAQQPAELRQPFRVRQSLRSGQTNPSFSRNFTSRGFQPSTCAQRRRVT